MVDRQLVKQVIQAMSEEDEITWMELLVDDRIERIKAIEISNTPSQKNMETGELVND